MDHFDEILRIQLILARLGERELLSWWNTDIAYKLGGSDFIQRLHGRVVDREAGRLMSLLSVAEALLTAAGQLEEGLLAAIPDRDGLGAFSLFCLEPALQADLHARFRHWKLWPAELPGEVQAVLDPQKDYKPAELLELLRQATEPAQPDGVAQAGTSFGREFAFAEGTAALDKVRALAMALAAPAAGQALPAKGAYVLNYYRASDAE